MTPTPAPMPPALVRHLDELFRRDETAHEIAVRTGFSQQWKPTPGNTEPPF